jgi:hypothetical protein
MRAGARSSPDYADPPSEAGFALWVLGLAASRKWSRARRGFRAQHERGASRDHRQALMVMYATGGRSMTIDNHLDKIEASLNHLIWMVTATLAMTIVIAAKVFAC